MGYALVCEVDCASVHGYDEAVPVEDQGWATERIASGWDWRDCWRSYTEECGSEVNLPV